MSQAKASSKCDMYYCGVCDGAYVEETEYCEDWIGCDHCDTWFHMPYVNIQPSEVPDTCSKIYL